MDIGLELGFFEERLTAEIDYYDRRTNDILVAVPIPAYVGSSDDPIVNSASVKNTGFDFDINWVDQKGDLSYSIGAVATTVNNEVTSLGSTREELIDGGVGIDGLLGSRTVVGESIGYFYGYKTEGVFQNQEQIDQIPGRGGEVPGDLIYQDTDDNGFVNENDYVNLGSPIPDFIYGLNLSMGYKGWDLSVAFNGVWGNQIYNSKKQSRFSFYSFETNFLDRRGFQQRGAPDYQRRT